MPLMINPFTYLSKVSLATRQPLILNLWTACANFHLCSVECLANESDFILLSCPTSPVHTIRLHDHNCRIRLSIYSWRHNPCIIGCLLILANINTALDTFQMIEGSEVELRLTILLSGGLDHGVTVTICLGVAPICKHNEHTEGHTASFGIYSLEKEPRALLQAWSLAVNMQWKNSMQKWNNSSLYSIYPTYFISCLNWTLYMSTFTHAHAFRWRSKDCT